MALNLDRQELAHVVSMMQPNVQKNLEIVTKEGLGQDMVYHIALRRQQTMVPNVSKRAGLTEDNTVPRVHVSRSLRDCVAGYNQLGDMARQYVPMADKDDKGKKAHAYQADYRGGFYIFEIPFVVGLAPNKKLTGDSDITNELWLVTYNQYTTTYPCRVVGRGFITEVTYQPRVGLYALEVVKMYIEVSGVNQIRLHDRKFLPKGYWELVLADHNLVSHRAIDREKWAEAKLRSATMLDHQEPTTASQKERPSYYSW